MNQFNDTLMLEIFEALNGQDSDAMRHCLEIIYNEGMKIERQHHLKASPYERSSERQGYANGYKDKTFYSRQGPLALKVPQTRGVDFYPSCLEKGSRSERALKLAIAEMYLKGVSTRKVTAITEELCGLEISSTQVSALAKDLDEGFEAFRSRPLGKMLYVFFDAIYVKTRHNGTVIDQAILMAYGINQEGRREFLGASTSLSEAEVHWRSFFEDLQKRGLRGVRLMVSDDHSGLTSAKKAVFPSVPWQRCQFHMSQNAQHYSPTMEMRKEIAGAMRSVFQCVTRESAEEAKKKVVSEFSKKAPEFASWFESNVDEGLTCLSFPEPHRKKIRTTNGLERVNREVKRRTRVATLFPSGESALRLITGVVIEIHEDWVTSRRYLDMSLLT